MNPRDSFFHPSAMITDLEKLSKVLDDSTLSRRVANTVRAQRVRIESEIKTRGSAVINVGGRNYRVVSREAESVKKRA